MNKEINIQKMTSSKETSTFKIPMDRLLQIASQRRERDTDTSSLSKTSCKSQQVVRFPPPLPPRNQPQNIPNAFHPNMRPPMDITYNRPCLSRLNASQFSTSGSLFTHNDGSSGVCIPNNWGMTPMTGGTHWDGMPIHGYHFPHSSNMQFIQSTPISNGYPGLYNPRQNESFLRPPPSVASTRLNTTLSLEQFMHALERYMERAGVSNDTRRIMHGFRQYAHDLTVSQDHDTASVYSTNSRTESNWSSFSRNPPSVRNLFRDASQSANKARVVFQSNSLSFSQNKTKSKPIIINNTTKKTPPRKSENNSNESSETENCRTVVRNVERLSPPPPIESEIIFKSSRLTEKIVKRISPRRLATIQDTPLRRKINLPSKHAKELSIIEPAKKLAKVLPTKKNPVGKENKSVRNKKEKSDEDDEDDEEINEDDWFVKPLRSKININNINSRNNKIAAGKKVTERKRISIKIPSPAPIKTRSGRTVKPVTYLILQNKMQISKKYKQINVTTTISEEPTKVTKSTKNKLKSVQKNKSPVAESVNEDKLQMVERNKSQVPKKPPPAEPSEKGKSKSKRKTVEKPVLKKNQKVTTRKQKTKAKDNLNEKKDGNNLAAKPPTDDSFFDNMDDIVISEVTESVRASARAKRPRGLKGLAGAQTPPLQLITANINSALISSTTFKKSTAVAASTSATPDWEPSQRTETDKNNYQKAKKIGKRKAAKTKNEKVPKKIARKSLTAALKFVEKNTKLFQKNDSDSENCDTDDSNEDDY